MKKELILLALAALTLVGCNKDNPKEKEEARPVNVTFTYKVSDNLVPYVKPTIAYVLPGSSSVVKEAASSKSFNLALTEGQFKIAMFCEAVGGKDISEIAGRSEKISFAFGCDLKYFFKDTDGKYGKSLTAGLNESDLSQLTPEMLQRYIFDHTNTDKKTATGKTHHYTFTIKKNSDGYFYVDSLEREEGSLFN